MDTEWMDEDRTGILRHAVFFYLYFINTVTKITIIEKKFHLALGDTHFMNNSKDSSVLTKLHKTASKQIYQLLLVFLTLRVHAN
jgi:hypothetical protein